MVMQTPDVLREKVWIVKSPAAAGEAAGVIHEIAQSRIHAACRFCQKNSRYGHGRTAHDIHRPHAATHGSRFVRKLGKHSVDNRIEETEQEGIKHGNRSFRIHITSYL